MSAPIPKHESVIDFDTATVKAAVDKFAEINRGSDFSLKDKNEIFGSYVFNIFKNNSWNGLSSGSMHVTLNAAEGNKTRVTVETLNKGQAQYANIRDLTDAQGDFLKSLSNILSGNAEPSAAQVPKGQGCLGVLLLLVGIASLIAYASCSKKSDTFCWDCYEKRMYSSGTTIADTVTMCDKSGEEINDFISSNSKSVPASQWSAGYYKTYDCAKK